MRSWIMIMALAAAPTGLWAQGGMGGGGMGGGGMGGGRGGPPGGMRGGGMGSRPSIPKFPTAKELEEFNAASALLEDKKKLKLTDEQLTRVTALQATLFERNGDLLARYDSVRREYKPPKMPDGPPAGGGMPGMPPGGGGGGGAPDERAMGPAFEQMRIMTDVGQTLIERRAQDVEECLLLLDESQRERGRKVLDEQTKELKKKIPYVPTGGRNAPQGRRSAMISTPVGSTALLFGTRATR